MFLVLFFYSIFFNHFDSLFLCTRQSPPTYPAKTLDKYTETLEFFFKDFIEKTKNYAEIEMKIKRERLKFINILPKKDSLQVVFFIDQAPPDGAHLYIEISHDKKQIKSISRERHKTNP